MKHLGFRVTVSGETHSFELRQAAIECARIAQATGEFNVTSVVEVLEIECAEGLENAGELRQVGNEWHRPIEWRERTEA